MWPWAHAATAYLVLSTVRRYRDQGPPTSVGAIAVGLGALAPDLIDKPLAWRLDVLPYGRTLAHSLLLAGVALLVVGVLARQCGHWTAFVPFAMGYLVHLGTDALHPVLVGDWEYLFFLAWPLTTAPETAETKSVIAHLLQLEPTPFFLFETLLTVVAVGLWWSHGRPGLPW